MESHPNLKGLSSVKAKNKTISINNLYDLILFNNMLYKYKLEWQNPK